MITKQDIHIFEEKHRILLKSNEYICLRPHPNLREYISNYNITFPTKDIMPSSFTAMPCGCGAFTIANDGKSLSAELDGPTIKPYNIGSQSSRLEMIVTIEFRPAGLYAVTGINQNELADKTIPVEAVNSSLGKRMSDIIEKSASVYDLVASMDALLLTNLKTAYRPELMLVLQDIKKYAGNISIKQLSNNANYSERQLNRIFNQFVGMGTKSFSRIIRINGTFHSLKNPHKNLAYISDMAGFHDLSHFINDFKLVSGTTPQAYRSNMSDFYNNPTRF